MENISLKINRSIFPLSKLHLNIEDKSYSMRSGEEILIPLNKTGKNNLNVNLFWINNKFKLDLNKNSTIKIKHIIPDSYYILSSIVLVTLAILSFFQLINILFLSIALLIYFFPIFYYSLFNRKKYFKVKVYKN